MNDQYCKLHDMYWCALCNGDAKKFEKSIKPDGDCANKAEAEYLATSSPQEEPDDV